MKIEDEINQTKPFGSCYQKVVVNFIYTSNWLTASQKEFFKPFGLTSKQYNILRILRGAGKPISTSVIRERMLDRMSDVSRIVDRLEKKALVIKDSCSADQRKIDVILTKKALELLKLIDIEMATWENDFTNLTDKEAIQLSDLLDKMRK